MNSKRLKGIGILFLSIIYLATSCLANFSFATTNAGENVAEGQYYIKNKNTSLYVGVLDYYSIVLSSLQGSSEMQRWELEYVSDGYYNIRSVYSDYYLTAASTLTEGADITEQALSSTTNNAQLWKFTDLESGQFATYKEYKISAKTHENTDLALVNDNYLTSYGYSLVQDTYTLDSVFYDEWVLIPIKDAYVVGINSTTSKHAYHSTGLNYIKELLDSEYYNTSIVSYDTTNVYSVTSHMENSNIFIMRSMGDSDDLGTYVRLSDGGMLFLHSWDIYNYEENNGINLSECELAVFAGCYTANHLTQSLPQAAVDAGADYAVGFGTDPECSEIAEWTKIFTIYYMDGEDVDTAALDAALEREDEELYHYHVFE